MHHELPSLLSPVRPWHNPILTKVIYLQGLINGTGPTDNENDALVEPGLVHYNRNG
jgi:hypothetical protein